MQDSLALIATKILFLILSGFTLTGLRKDCSVKRETAPKKNYILTKKPPCRFMIRFSVVVLATGSCRNPDWFSEMLQPAAWVIKDKSISI